LIGGVWAGGLLIGPFRLLTPVWPKLLTGLMPVLRMRLPLASLAFDIPFCASAAEAPHANMQKIPNVNLTSLKLICPRSEPFAFAPLQ
jgi:hypothetical protein